MFIFLLLSKEQGYRLKIISIPERWDFLIVLRLCRFKHGHTYFANFSIKGKNNVLHFKGAGAAFSWVFQNEMRALMSMDSSSYKWLSGGSRHMWEESSFLKVIRTESHVTMWLAVQQLGKPKPKPVISWQIWTNIHKHFITWSLQFKKTHIWKCISFVPCFSFLLQSWGTTDCKEGFSLTPEEIYFPCHMD